MLSEEKKQNKLINTNVITKHNITVISCDAQLRRSSFSLFKLFPIKVNDVTIKTIKIQELSSPKGESTYTLSNRYNGADLMFLFKEGLSLIIRRLSFSSNRNFLSSLVSTLKFYQVTNGR